MTRSHLHTIISILVALSIAGTSSVATAKPGKKEQALKLFKEAKRLYDDGQYRKAIPRFGSSNDLYPHLNTVYYMAEAYRRIGELRAAHKHYSRFAAMLSDDKQAEYRVKLKKMRWERPCKLSVASQPGGAEVKVDGKTVAQTPPDGTPVNLMIKGGSHQIMVTLKDYEPVTRKMDGEFGEPLALSVVLKPAAKPGPAKPEPTKPEPVKPEEKPESTRGPTLGEVMAAKGKVDAEAKKSEPEIKAERKPEPDTAEDHPGDGVYVHLYVGVAFQDYGDIPLELGTATAFGLQAGYLLRWGRVGLQLGAMVAAAPVNDKTGNTEDESISWFVSYLAGPGLRVYILDNLWAGASLFLGASSLFGASGDSFFFTKSTHKAVVTGLFTSFALRPEITIGWHVWKGLSPCVIG